MKIHPESGGIDLQLLASAVNGTSFFNEPNFQHLFSHAPEGLDNEPGRPTQNSLRP